MIHTRRGFVCLAVVILLSLLLYYRSVSAAITIRSLRNTVPQVVGLGDYFDGDEKHLPGGEGPSPATVDWQPPPNASHGGPGHEYTYSRNLVMARIKEEDVSWLDEVDLGPDIAKMVYVADDPGASLHPPQNKGHEVMVYLTYLIDFYDRLPDVSIFMHSHRTAWHNDDLLQSDSGEMIKRLSSARVQRQGYMNLRCHWMPGCPEWIHPGQIEEDAEKKEQALMADAWAELFPLRPIPDVLAQPCCSQFALSKDMIRALPRARYVHFRDWLLRSDLGDSMSGRIFEYLWQVIFTDQATLCPNQRTCYCDGFGVCFETEEAFDKWFEMRFHMRTAEEELREWEEQAEEIEKYRKDGKLQEIESGELTVPEFGKREELLATIEELEAELEYRRQQAIERGKDPHIRADSDGRPWHAGDGY